MLHHAFSQVPRDSGDTLLISTDPVDYGFNVQLFEAALASFMILTVLILFIVVILGVKQDLYNYFIGRFLAYCRSPKRQAFCPNCCSETLRLSITKSGTANHSDYGYFTWWEGNGRCTSCGHHEKNYSDQSI